MKNRRAACVAMVLALAAGVRTPVWAATETLSQFTLAAQHDWGGKKGFYLIIDNHSTDGQPAPLSAARLTLGIGDGQSWQGKAQGALTLGQAHQARVVINEHDATLWLDGQEVGKLNATMAPADREAFVGNVQQPWARGPAEYEVVQTKLVVNSPAWDENQSWAELTPAQRVMGVSHKVSDPRPLRVPITLTATFTLQPPVDVATVGPLVDAYGQATIAEWPEKVINDADLKAATQKEDDQLRRWGEPADRDAYGGLTDLGWRERGTGYFRVMQRGGTWWLLSPQGNPLFYTGVCTAPAQDWDATPLTGREMLFTELPARDGPAAAAYRGPAWGERQGEYLALQAANMEKKYGDDWAKIAAELTLRRLKVWGFSGLGKWTGMRGAPELVVLGRSRIENLGRHPDTFDPATRERFRQNLEDQIRPRLSDPYVIGWSVGNEYDECFTDQEIKDILARHDAPAGKKALIDRAIELHGGVAALDAAWGAKAGSTSALYAKALTPVEKDIEPLRQFLARDYYKFLYTSIKGIDPNHLYFSGWVVPGWWQNENDWKMQEEFCDVLGYDQYAYDFGAAPAKDLIASCKKPVLVGEFSFPASYGGARGFGRYQTAVPDDAASGAAYAHYVEAAAGTAHCVGIMWFQYRDEPITGRGPVEPGLHAVEGENYAFGLVDVTDRPKWPLVERVRAVNLQVNALHSAAR